MTVTQPDWTWQVPNAPVHTVPSQIGGPALPPLNPQQFAATFGLVKDFFIGEIAIAFGGIEILGWHPFDFLVTWGSDLEAQALAAYLGQQTANINLATLLDGVLGAGHTFTELADFITDIPGDVQAVRDTIAHALGHSGGEPYSNSDVLGFLGAIPGTLISGAINTAVTISGNAISALFNGSGLIASEIAGAINTAVTISGNALSSLFNGSGVLGSAVNGALNTAVTISGNALSTLFNGSGLIASQIAGALNTGITISGNAISSLFNSSGVLASALTGAVNTAVTISGNAISSLFNASGLIASQIAGALNTAVTIGGTAVSTLFQYLDSLGRFDAAQVTGALNTAITVSGNAISSLFNGSGALASALTGAINTAVTVSGNALSTLFNGSGALASALTGAVNTAVTISGNAISTLFNGSGVIASQIAGALSTAVTIGGTAISTLFQYLDSLGQFSAAHVTGALNTAITISGNAISALFNGSGALASALTGAINTGVTIAGNAVSTLFNSSGLIASQIAGALNTAVTISGNAISSLFNSSGVLASIVNGALNTAVTISGNAVSTLFNGSGLIASQIAGALNTAVTISGNAISTLFSASGVLASALTGAINTAVTISGNAISSLFSASGVLASALTGAFNTATTISGKALSTLFNSSGLIASQIAGALNTAVTISGNAISSLFSASGVLASAVTGVLSSVNIPDITLAMSGAMQNIVDYIYQAIFGGSTTGNLVGTVLTGIQSVFSNLFGQNSLGTTVTAPASGFDNLINALTGGSATGQSPSSVSLPMTTIPPDNVSIPANPGSGTITRDTSTNGTPVTGSTTTLSITPWSHTTATDANYITVEVATVRDVGISAPTTTVTYGGVAMTRLTGNSAFAGGTKQSTFDIYGLKNPPTGANNVAISLSATSGAYYTLMGAATSWKNVKQASTAHVTSGTNSSPTYTFTATSGNVTVGGIQVQALSSETLSSLNASWNSRYNSGSTLSGGTYMDIISCDSSTTGSVTLSATASFTTTCQWDVIAIELQPIPATILGSGIEYKRASATAVTPSTSTTTTFANSFFDTQVTKTSDITYSTTGNTVTVTNAGWYDFAMSVSSGNTTIAGGQRMTCVLFKNGSAFKAGGDGFGTSSGVGAAIISHMACPVYLSAGDTIQPGYRATGSVNQFKENNSGVDTWFSLALANRGLWS